MRFDVVGDHMRVLWRAPLAVILVALAGCGGSGSGEQAGGSGSGTGGTGGSGGNGGGTQPPISFPFTDPATTPAQAAAFLVDEAQYAAFVEALNLPASGQIVFYRADGGGSPNTARDQIVVDFGAGTATLRLARSFEPGFDREIVYAFDRRTGEFADRLSAESRIGTDNIKRIFAPALAGNYAAVFRDPEPNLGDWFALSTNITSPLEMPTSGGATYSGQGVFDVRSTGLAPNLINTIPGSEEVWRGQVANAGVSVNFGDRSYRLTLSDFPEGPIGRVEAAGTYYRIDLNGTEYPFGQADGINNRPNFTRDIDVFDRAGAFLGSPQVNDTTGDQNFVNFAGPDASEVFGEPAAGITTTVGGNRRIEFEGAYVAGRD